MLAPVNLEKVKTSGIHMSFDPAVQFLGAYPGYSLMYAVCYMLQGDFNMTCPSKYYRQPRCPSGRGRLSKVWASV